VILLGQVDDNVEPFLDGDRVGQRREDRASMLSDLLLQIRLVRVDALGTCLPICLLACLGEWWLRA
jgi:hypothetical protein